MNVVTVIVAIGHHLHIGFKQGRLLGELLRKEMFSLFKRLVEQPADESKCKHILAAQDTLVVQTASLQAGLCQRTDRYTDHLGRFDMELLDWVIGLEFGFLQPLGIECILINYHYGIAFDMAYICFQGGRIHGNQNVCLVTGGVNLARADMNLIARNTTQATLWGTHLSRIVWKCRNLIAEYGRQSRKKSTCQLHSVT